MGPNQTTASGAFLSRVRPRSSSPSKRAARPRGWARELSGRPPTKPSISTPTISTSGATGWSCACGRGTARSSRRSRRVRPTAASSDASRTKLSLAIEPNLEHASALLAPDLRDVISPSALKPQFRTRFSRISHQFATDSCITRASFDGGCIEATGRSELISEVEFKLKGGRLNSYTQECLSFLAEVPAALLIESKAARGYRLAAGELPHAIGAPHLVVPWNLPLPQAILRILRHGFQHFLDNYPAVTLAAEPEGIHQMRVAVRRLLSAIRMFAPVVRLEDTRGLFQALKTIFTPLGGVREADVFIAETLLPLAAAGLGKTLE